VILYEWAQANQSLIASPPSVPDISGTVKNSMCHVCRIYLAELPLFASLLGDRNIYLQYMHYFGL